MKTAIIHRTTQSELTPSETLYTDSIDYLLGGALTLRNGRIDKYQFDEGYCQAEEYNSTKDDFTFCYYDKDHLGNVRQVTALDGSSGGNVIQRNNYYPFGAEFCDGNANTSVQSRKYNGKEFDNMHGLNTYDYGARQYNPVTARWDRVDPLAHEYYSVSPYVYCMNNPVKFVDPDGKDTFPFFVNILKQTIGYMLEFGANDHNKRTIGYAINNPLKALRTGIVGKSNTISDAASNFEVNIAKDTELRYGEKGDQGNAIRHTLWQSILTVKFGENDATRIGNAHEDNHQVDTSMKNFSKLEEADFVVDKLNNQIGREIGKSNPKASNVELAKKVMAVYHSSGLYVVKKQGATFKVVREKINDQQYVKAIRVINKKNDQGLNK